MRSRCSILVQWQGKSLLVDTPPELRQQAIRSHVRRVDAILYTHSHADHLFGLDDVRRFNEMQEGDLPILARPDVLADLERAYRYVFMQTQVGGGKPRLQLVPIEGDIFECLSLRVEAIPVLHGRLPITAFRFGAFAYATDVSEISAESRERLRGLDTLVLSALRHEPHPTHLTVTEALRVIEDLAPRQAYLVHMSHGLMHRRESRQLPALVRFAYDGLIIDLPDANA